MTLVALVAGAGPGRAALLGASMALLQFAIGALNDLVDAPRDAAAGRAKPIPAGLVDRRAARAVMVAAGAGGLLLSLAGGPALLALALLVLLVGASYDLRAKGTTLSWLPFALGIPLLPVYGWYGGAGELPGLFVVLVPAAANAGTALAVANALVDMERDADAGTDSIALALGHRRAGLLVLVLHGVVAALAVGTALVLDAPDGWTAAVVATAAAPLAGALLGLSAGGPGRTGRRELAWEIQALGTALLAVAWLSALGAAAGTAPGP